MEMSPDDEQSLQRARREWADEDREKKRQEDRVRWDSLKMTPEQIRDEQEETEWEAEEKRKEEVAKIQKLADEKEARHQIWLQKRNSHKSVLIDLLLIQSQLLEEVGVQILAGNCRQGQPAKVEGREIDVSFEPPVLHDTLYQRIGRAMREEIKDVSEPRRDGVFHLWEAMYFDHGAGILDQEYKISFRLRA
jgi:hypothetical protein